MQVKRRTILSVLALASIAIVSGAWSPPSLSSSPSAALAAPRTSMTTIRSQPLRNDHLPLATSLALPGLILAATILISSPCHAFDAQVFANNYDDPLHPQCRRHIVVTNTKDGSFRYDGTAVGPKGADSAVLHGCSKEEIKTYGLRTGTFTGQINGDKISAGDGIHEGVWEPAGSVAAGGTIKYTDVDGIRWNDGNKWIVKTKSTATRFGEFIFLSYIGFSTLAGFKGVADMVQRKRKVSSK